MKNKELNMVNCNKLLLEINKMIVSKKEINSKEAKKFNVFKILNDESDEVKICRFIFELINPNGSHEQGTLFLNLFFKYALNIEISDNDLNLTKCYREFVLNNNRRIDIVIETPSKFIPIEVKIYARDQYNQIRDYYNESAKLKENTDNIYYLTLTGYEPSEESKSGIDNEKIKCISFSSEIITWLDKCIEETNNKRINRLTDLLEQFKDNINNLCGNKGDNIKMDVKELLLKSKENFESAMQLNEGLKSAKIEIMKKLFDSIYNKLKNDKIIGPNIYENFSHNFYYNDYYLVKEFYNKVSSTYPSINIRYKKAGEDGLSNDVWIRVEIDYRLFVGYCIPEKDNWSNTFHDMNEIASHLPTIESAIRERSRNWWCMWEYIKYKNDTINFKTCEGLYLDLLNDEVIEDIANETYLTVKKYFVK